MAAVFERSVGRPKARRPAGGVMKRRSQSPARALISAHGGTASRRLEIQMLSISAMNAVRYGKGEMLGERCSMTLCSERAVPSKVYGLDLIRAVIRAAERYTIRKRENRVCQEVEPGR